MSPAAGASYATPPYPNLPMEAFGNWSPTRKRRYFGRPPPPRYNEVAERLARSKAQRAWRERYLARRRGEYARSVERLRLNRLYGVPDERA